VFVAALDMVTSGSFMSPLSAVGRSDVKGATHRALGPARPWHQTIQRLLVPLKRPGGDHAADAVTCPLPLPLNPDAATCRWSLSRSLSVWSYPGFADRSTLSRRKSLKN